MASTQEYVCRFNVCPDEFECVENYMFGGLHPISIGDSFAEGRYRILHKLGNGASSTVWLARDQRYTNPGKLVALKALRADSSFTYNYELPIQDIIRAANPPISNIQTVEDYFFVDGPNGTHLFLIYPLGGPSIFEMCCESSWKRLRGDLARKVSKQLMSAVEGLHRVGVIHGDITTKNVLFSLKPHVTEWTDKEVYDILGDPLEDTYKVETRDGSPLPACVPAELIYPIDYKPLMSPSFLEEQIVLVDFGQSYPSTVDYTPGPQIHYQAPEVHFEEKSSFEADVWALACTIFEIRSGHELFSSYFGDINEILLKNVAMLGRFPDPWWEKFEGWDKWFLEDGEPKLTEGKKRYAVKKTSIREGLRLIGSKDSALFVDEESDNWAMLEKIGVMLAEGEVELLGDLLEGMLKLLNYPEDRIKLHEVVNHPWFEMSK